LGMEVPDKEQEQKESNWENEWTRKANK
jgi:hypothetical protein